MLQARIIRREAANQHLRQMSHKQQLSAPDVERQLQEAERTRQKLRIVSKVLRLLFLGLDFCTS
jgi:hypothetical protein